MSSSSEQSASSNHRLTSTAVVIVIGLVFLLSVVFPASGNSRRLSGWKHEIELLQQRQHHQQLKKTNENSAAYSGTTRDRVAVEHQREKKTRSFLSDTVYTFSKQLSKDRNDNNNNNNFNFSAFRINEEAAMRVLLDQRRIIHCVGSQKILFVGHSHIRDVFCSLGHYTDRDRCLKKSAHPLTLRTGFGDEIHDPAQVGGGPSGAAAIIGTVHHERDTYLSDTAALKNKYIHGRGTGWNRLAVIKDGGFDVIVPGRGAWDLAYYNTDEKDFRQTYVTALKGLVEMLNKNNPDARVIIYLLHYFHPPTNPAFKVCTTEQRVAAYRDQTIRAAAEAAEWAKKKFPEFKAPVQLFDVYEYTKQLPRSAADGWGHHFRPGGVAAAVIADSLMKDGICPTLLEKPASEENDIGLPKGVTISADPISLLKARQEPQNGEDGNHHENIDGDDDGNKKENSVIEKGLHSCECQKWGLHSSCSVWEKVRDHGVFFKKGEKFGLAREVCTEFSVSSLSAKEYKIAKQEQSRSVTESSSGKLSSAVLSAGRAPSSSDDDSDGDGTGVSSTIWDIALSSTNRKHEKKRDEDQGEQEEQRNSAVSTTKPGALLSSGIHSSYPDDPSLHRWNAVAPLQYATLIRLMCDAPHTSKTIFKKPDPMELLDDNPIGQCLKVMGRTANVTDTLFEPFPFEWVVERMSRTGKAPPCLCTSSDRSLVFEKGLQEFKKSGSGQRADGEGRSLPTSLKRGGWERMIADRCEEEAEEWRKAARNWGGEICGKRHPSGAETSTCLKKLRQVVRPYAAPPF